MNMTYSKARLSKTMRCNRVFNGWGKVALAALLASVGALVVQAQNRVAGSDSAGQTLTTLRATELRADKLASAAVIRPLAMGAGLRLLSVEGGWALVETVSGGAAPKQTGWVRAGAVSLQVDNAGAAGLASGRESAGNMALTLGVRGMTPRVNRHALVIGVSRYADPATSPLPGARIDKISATQMAQAMQVPLGNIKYLQDDEATGNNIRKALDDLTQRVQTGDRVFIHYSGHGTRYKDEAAGGCVEALLAYDGDQITNREMTDLLKTITGRTDKLFVMYDACHSGGLLQGANASRTRGLVNANDEGALRPKFSSITEECGRPVNVKTRNLLVEQTAKGVLPQDVIHISAARDNEISFDDEFKGGLATQFMRDCMLREAKDLDGSGAISIDEIRQCAQEKINHRMRNDANYKPHNLLLSGNSAFVPAWFSQANTGLVVPPGAIVAAALPAPSAPAPVAPAMRPPALTPAPLTTPTNRPGETPPFAAVTAALGSTATLTAVAAAPLPAVLPGTLPALAVPPALTGDQALRQMFDQRDAKRNVQVATGSKVLRIGQDALDFSVQSDRAGYVYVAMAGSDNKSLYLLFPNDLDQNNKVEAGQRLQLPRPNWRVRAAGPAGKDHLLVMVADGPRDLAALGAQRAGPFVTSLNDSQGRAQLGALMTTSSLVTSQACTQTAQRQSNAMCSDAYGAALFSVEEVR